MNLVDLKKKNISELIKIAESMSLHIHRLQKEEVISSILKEHVKQGGDIFGGGVLEIMENGFGFLRSVENSYMPNPNDIYVSNHQMRKHSLCKGDSIFGKIKAPGKGENYFSLVTIDTINGGNNQNKILFESLTALYPQEVLKMEIDQNSENITGRVIDLITPIGVGCRGIIVAPPRSGKTMMLQSIAHSIAVNHPECFLIVLLIGERPEEVTDMKRSVKGEVVASTFDEHPSRHVKLANLVIERAKRLVENNKQDVVILLDSITRLTRAYNAVIPSSGKVLTGGIDANALQGPKQFFGKARKLEEGGSLTILGTVLVDTNSKMDSVIYEELKGSGNMEIHLDRDCSEKRIFPAIDVNRSGTRREELLINESKLGKVWILRRIMHGMQGTEPMEFLLDRLKKTANNEEFFRSMGQSS